jgi:hypothetical protein
MMTNPHHPEHQRLTEWYGGSFDLDDLNLPVISGRISKLARRRALGKAGFVKKPRTDTLSAPMGSGAHRV